MKILAIALLLFTSTSGSNSTKKYNGTWTRTSTTYVYDFDLILKTKASNKAEGFFVWTLVNYDENSEASKNYYAHKVGKTAKEYVRGTYNPSAREYTLEGYKKDDPNQIIGIDSYKLTVDKSGNIEGTSKTGGSWTGIIKAKPDTASSKGKN